MFYSQFLFFWFILFVICGLNCYAEDEYKLKISSNSEEIISTHLINENVNNTLELTCQLEGFTAGHNISLNWELPKYNEKRLNTILTEHRNGSVKLTLKQLTEKDGGKYVCEAHIDRIPIRETVIVHVKQKLCVNMFGCSTPSPPKCIHHRYVCDGLKDCDNGLDEHPHHCGRDVCKDRIVCNDGRCIPNSWCCHPIEPNCTARIRHPCCPPLPPDDYLYRQNIINNQHYNEMSFLQRSIYTIAGFVMVFMSIVTILMIAICRIHLQRFVSSSVPWRSGCNTRTPPLSTVQREDTSDIERLASTRMLVSYNIPRNGLEIVGDICEPPPYSQVTPYSDPPPSYLEIFNNRTDEESVPCLSTEKPPP